MKRHFYELPETDTIEVFIYTVGLTSRRVPRTLVQTIPEKEGLLTIGSQADVTQYINENRAEPDIGELSFISYDEMAITEELT